jgi:Zn-dependent protease with chaperone function
VASKLATAMRVSSVRTAAAVVVLTALVCVVAVAGDGPIRERPQPYAPSRSELIEVGVISADFPVPGALPPEVFPPEAYGLGPPGPPAWLWWLLGAIAAAAGVWVALRIVRKLMRIGWRLPRLRRWWWRWRARTAPGEPPVTEPAQVVDDEEAQVAREAVDAALAPLREPADPRAAVIEAYARMERVLAERELGRRSPEAPREYLRRVIREQGMPDESLTTLTALFEEARFSRHPIPESAPGRAAIELQTARAALAAATSAAETR